MESIAKRPGQAGMITPEKIEELYTEACTADLGGTPRKRWSVVLAELVNAHERLERLEFDDDRPAQPRREQRRIFQFATGDEVDVDRIVAIDANAKSSTLHISLMHGAFLRVHFIDDEQRREQLAALRKLRADA